MDVDWTRNNKIGLRNLKEASDFHDLVKTLIVRMLRREHPDSHNVHIYTEFSPDKPREEFPDIWMSIKKDIIVFEIQKKITKEWTKKVVERYKDCDLIIVELEKDLKEWNDKIHSKNETDPIKLLRNILNKYIV